MIFLFFNKIQKKNIQQFNSLGCCWCCVGPVMIPRYCCIMLYFLMAQKLTRWLTMWCKATNIPADCVKTEVRLIVNGHDWRVQPPRCLNRANAVHWMIVSIDRRFYFPQTNQFTRWRQKIFPADETVLHPNSRSETSIFCHRNNTLSIYMCLRQAAMFRSWEGLGVRVRVHGVYMCVGCARVCLFFKSQCSNCANRGGGHHLHRDTVVSGWQDNSLKDFLDDSG